jgi:hypothetical protein
MRSARENGRKYLLLAITAAGDGNTAGVVTLSNDGAKPFCYTQLQGAATASRHVLIAAVRILKTAA